MLQVLVESRAVRPHRASWTAMSFLVHSAAIACAVVLTARVAQVPGRAEPLEEIIYVAPPPAMPIPTHTAPLSSLVPFAISHPVFTVPAIIPPPITATTPDFMSRVIDDLSRTTVGTIGSATPGAPASPDGIHTAETVDRVVAPLPGNATPGYPARLSAAGIEGDVIVRFVVDTTGRVEPASVEILQASHAQFGDAVRQWLTRTRYAPASVQGRAVRQLVRQRVGFSLTR